mgnify:FL=1|jgi:hypothetical protein|tara:strand:+ start:12725 stop:12943 length:219 start_codon:yes stop_codon:yes gene_type:complete
MLVIYKFLRSNRVVFIVIALSETEMLKNARMQKIIIYSQFFAIPMQFSHFSALTLALSIQDNNTFTFILITN